MFQSALTFSRYKMFRLVLGCLAASVLLVSLIQAHPLDDDYIHTRDPPITVKKFSSLGSHRADGDYRLSGDAVPVHYDVWLQTKLHMQDFTFSGQVKIIFDAMKDADHVILHTYQLKIWEADVKDLQTNVTYLLYETLDEDKELLTLRSISSEPLRIIGGHQYELFIKYEGTLRRDNGGFYLSSYQRANGETVYMATTQFQAADARHAFPCFDEPGYKATFDIAITHGLNHNAISNMPVKRIDSTSMTSRTTYFETTPKMSTYLVAFIVSDFEYTESREANVLHRVYSRPDTKNQQQFALDTSKKTVEYLSEYLDVPYSLPKVDNVAIPDFAAGAMENWGLITYREEVLLFDREKSAASTELNVATVIAHEFAHQWFGNLVTPKWWQYIWMNEGFATLYEHLTVCEIYPDYNAMQNFAVSHYQRALYADGVKSPRAMSSYVETRGQISSLFDSITYSKAGSVLRMIQHVMGDSTFRKALNSYLKENAYRAVEEDDLFKHLIAAVGSATIPGLPTSSMEAFFKSWTNQGGYPVLTVTRNYTAENFEIMQEIYDGTNTTNSTVTFVVPFNYVYGNNPNFTDTSPQGFLNKVKSVTVSANSNGTKNAWLLLNKQLTGYYRVNYDFKNWDLLIDQLIKDHIVIDVMNRAQLIDDSFELAFADRLDHTLPLALLRYMTKEEHYAPWAAASNALSTLNTYLLGGEDYDLFEYFLLQHLNPIYKKVGVAERQNDTMHIKFIRNIAINWACRASSESCMADTNKWLNTVIDSGKDVEPSVKAAIFCNGLIKGGEKEFVYIFRRILDSKDQAERRQLMPSLGCSRNETLLMEFAMTSTAYSSEINYRPTERVNVLPSIIDKNLDGLRTAIKFLTLYHAEYYNLGATGFLDSNPLISIMSRIAVRIYSKDLSDEFDKLLVAVKTGPAANSTQLNVMRTRIDSNLQWTEKNRKKYIVWLDRFRNDAKSSVVSTLTLVLTFIVSVKSYL